MSTLAPVRPKHVLALPPSLVDSEVSSSSARRVLFAIDQLRHWGGAERMLVETIKRLDRTRFIPSVVTFDLNPDLPALNHLNAPVHFIPLRKTYDWQAFRAAGRLRRLLQEGHIDILHSFFETSDLWASPIAHLCGCRVIVSSRRDMGILRTRKHTLAYPRVNRIFSKVITVSDEVRKFTIEQDKLPAQNVETLYNGIDVEEVDSLAVAYEARKRFSIPQECTLITLVANVRRVKGIDCLIRAASIVTSYFPGIRFAVAGEVLEIDTMAELVHLISDLKIEDNFSFLGPVENPYPLLAESDVFVLPSRNEGFSNSLIEAMASGLPCVATRVGGNAEALEDGVSGFLVAPEDDEALADRLLALLRDPEAALKMGRCARERAMQRFALDSVVDRLMNIYDELSERVGA